VGARGAPVRFDAKGVYDYNQRRGAGRGGHVGRKPTKTKSSTLQLQWSAYAYQLRNWLEHIPAHRILVVPFSRFQKEPMPILTEVGRGRSSRASERWAAAAWPRRACERRL